MIKKALTVLFLVLMCIEGYAQSKLTPGSNFEANFDEISSMSRNPQQEFVSLIQQEENTSPVKQDTVGTLMDVTSIKVGIVLPFINKSHGKSARFIEYYEGFLLALQELKAQGLSASVYVFDMNSETGTDKLISLLDTYEMKSLDLIIGGVSAEQIDVISNFAQEQGIKYVIPFPTRTNEVNKNNEVFQLNAPFDIQFGNSAKMFADMFESANIIYIAENGGTEKKEFMSALNAQLGERGIKTNTIATGQNLASNLSSALDPNHKNVIVATSGSLQLLQSILPALNSVRVQQPNAIISLLGQTEWQTYTQYFADFYKNDTYIFTPFYLSDDDYNVKQFITKYQTWYNGKLLINTYPKYGALGYDTGIYFLTALLKYGKNFESFINSVPATTLQIPISFEKYTDGGYINNGLYMIHYKTNGVVDKTKYSK